MTQVATVFTQAQFDEFARLSGDDNPIHIDPEFSAKTRFGRTVAHGMFLLSVLQAEVARLHGGAVWIAEQEFIFRGPTFTGDPLLFDLEPRNDGTIGQVITDSSGTIVTDGTTRLGVPDGATPPQPRLIPSPDYKSLRVGMSASRTRLFTPDDVADYLRLVGDPNPLYTGLLPELPPLLLGGMVSWVLGVDLPGRGTNWLKQRDRFHQVVTVPAEVTTTVTITRLRPDKGLVNLANSCVVNGQAVASGESLVLAVDV